jgi:hypothetical protein
MRTKADWPDALICVSNLRRRSGRGRSCTDVTSATLPPRSAKQGPYLTVVIANTLWTVQACALASAQLFLSGGRKWCYVQRAGWLYGRKYGLAQTAFGKRRDNKDLTALCGGSIVGAKREFEGPPARRGGNER